MTLADLLRETIEPPENEIWENERTPFAIKMNLDQSLTRWFDIDSKHPILCWLDKHGSVLGRIHSQHRSPALVDHHPQAGRR